MLGYRKGKKGVDLEWGFLLTSSDQENLHRQGETWTEMERKQGRKPVDGWSEDLNSSPRTYPLCGGQHFTSYLIFLVLGLLICQLGVKIKSCFQRSLWCLYTWVIVALLARVQATWPFAYGSQGNQIGVIMSCNWKYKELSFAASFQSSLSTVHSCGLTSQHRGASRDLPSLISYLTSFLHFLLLKHSSPCPDL